MGQDVRLSRNKNEIRLRAARRMWFCPGAGYALVGRPRLGLATYLSVLAAMLGLGWVVLVPDPVVGRVSLVLLGLAIALGVSELIAVKWAAIKPCAPVILVRGYPVAAAVGWMAGGGVVVATFLSVGSFRMAGDGMSPTIGAQEQTVFHKRVQADELRRGRVIAFRTSGRSAWQPGAIVVARIIAGPGDRIATQDGRYLVNGESGPPVFYSTLYQPVVLVPTAPESLTVPDDCYFMCQEKPKESYDSSILSWAEKTNIVSSRLWYLRRDRLLDRIE